jgi:transcriptional regulator with XRE-family HTH domain
MSSVPPTPLAAAIKARRKQLGSHAKYAARIGTTAQTVIRWEQGAQPREHLRDALITDGIDPELFEAAVDPAKFSTALLGQIVSVLEQEPDLIRLHPDLLRGLAAEFRVVASRLEAAAESASQGDVKPPS